jgi:GT2 family glycosyltransferase
VRPDGVPQASAWRFPSVGTALAGALFLHRLLTVQSKGRRTREVDWCQSAALLVRRAAAEQVGYLDPDFFVYSDEVDFARRLRGAGWRSVYVPDAASGGSSSSRATATCTCASTTPPPPRGR